MATALKINFDCNTYRHMFTSSRSGGEPSNFEPVYIIVILFSTVRKRRAFLIWRTHASKNRGLMPEADFTAEELETLKQVILDCEKALAKSELPDNILVHRQAGYGMLDLYKKAPNGIFHDEGFTSTTPVKGSFSGSIDIEIKVPAGKGAGMWVDPISEYKGENEFLLNRGTKFKVVEIDESGKRPLVKLEVIGRDAKEVTKMLKRKVEKAKRDRSDKFTWTPADVKVQDKDGKWIRGDEFLNSLKAKPEKK